MQPPVVAWSARWRGWFGQSVAAQVMNLIMLFCVVWVAVGVVQWAVLTAIAPWQDPALCQDAQGACWPFLTEKLPLMLFGTFPYEERWRALLVSLSLLVMSSATLFQWCSWRWQAFGWLVCLFLFATLMGGGFAGFSQVPTAQWNGLPVLLFLGAVSLAAALPVGLLLALGRQSKRAWLCWPSTILIETLRGIPMVAVLFFGVFVLPLLTGSFKLSAIYAALIVLVFFHGAYVAEDLRSGLQSIPKGQWEASASLGLKPWQSLRFVVLPQAIRSAVPALTNTAIGGFKDTSLIVLVGLHDMLSTAKMAFSDPSWQAYALEAYVFVGLVFFVINGVIAAAGRRLEKAM
jgi:general L-amino acid transport system permease protein